ncbi:NAD(P)/FAD-dependent oxidoreductase [Pseudolysinimonas sp.]|uniref:NAD(P)/FAD-dependent oxidoreductase n=1 Tax=Pseudolysinimonas sp. TaxID=2680009 RepID=UPI00286CEE84|nr:NAD(P)/FAD-dependent oxidoreductase [Pseudolysinimonas sp.]
MSVDTDVLIAGGGPVGLAAAIEARLAGLDVTVVEPRDGPIDKACGEGLMPGALPELARLGVDPDGMPFQGIAYLDGKRRVEHRFDGGPGRGVRRTVLHAALRDRAVAAGVRFFEGRVEGVHQRAGFVEAVGLRAAWLLGADGLHSAVARETGLALPPPMARRRFGQRRHYALPPWSEFVEVLWTRAGEFYVTPVGERVVGIALLARRGEHFDDALAAAPALAERLRGVEAASDLRGAGPLRQRTRARVAGRVLLVGDASGYVDALTGEGLRIGFAQARAAIAAITADQPEGYEAAWERETRDFRRLTGALVRLAASPLRGAVVPVAARFPAVFAAAVERLAR